MFIGANFYWFFTLSYGKTATQLKVQLRSLFHVFMVKQQIFLRLSVTKLPRFRVHHDHVMIMSWLSHVSTDHPDHLFLQLQLRTVDFLHAESWPPARLASSGAVEHTKNSAVDGCEWPVGRWALSILYIYIVQYDMNIINILTITNWQYTAIYIYIYQHTCGYSQGSLVINSYQLVTGARFCPSTIMIEQEQEILVCYFPYSPTAGVTGIVANRYNASFWSHNGCVGDALHLFEQSAVIAPAIKSMTCSQNIISISLKCFHLELANHWYQYIWCFFVRKEDYIFNFGWVCIKYRYPKIQGFMMAL